MQKGENFDYRKTSKPENFCIIGENQKREVDAFQYKQTHLTCWEGSYNDPSRKESQCCTVYGPPV